MDGRRDSPALGRRCVVRPGEQARIASRAGMRSRTGHADAGAAAQNCAAANGRNVVR